MQSVWGNSLGDLGNKSWAEDAMEEEAEHGQIAAPEVSTYRVTRPMKEDEFPELGLGAQAAASKGGGGKKVKKGKGRKMALDEFNSVGINHLDERSKILNALPKHATGAEVPDRFGRGGGMGMGGGRPQFDDEPSKADGSDNWGGDKRPQPGRPAGGFGGGGGGGGFGDRGGGGGFGDRGGGGFSRGGADDDAAWSRGGGGGVGPPAPRRNGFGGSAPRDDDGAAWSRNTQRPQIPDRPDRGGFGASRANEDGAWSRGTRAPEPRSEGGGGRQFNDSRADEEAVWSRGSGQQPSAPSGGGGGGDGAVWARGSAQQPPAPAPGGDDAAVWSRGSGQQPPAPTGGAHSQADDVSTWARKEPRDRPVPVTTESHHAADATENWTRGKPGPKATRRTDSPRDSVGGSEKSGFASPREARESRDSHKSAAGEVKTWAHNPQSKPQPSVKKPHPRNGRWGKQEAPIDREAPKEERFSKPEQPSPKVEVEEPGEEEVQLQSKLAELQLRQDAGEGDADSQDVGEDGALITIDEALEACQLQIDELAAAREANAQERTSDADKWTKAPKEEASMSGSATETAEKVEAGEDGEAEEGGDDEGFSEVVSRASAKREKAAVKAAQPAKGEKPAKSAQPASGRGSSSGGGGKAPAIATPPRKAGPKW